MKPASRKPAAPKVSETAEHRAIVAYLKRIGLGGNAYWFHTRNERPGDYQRINAARMGVRGGLPDLGFVDSGQSGWVEIKPRGWLTRTARTGTYTPHERRQLDVHAALKRAGAWVEVCETLEQMLDALKWHGVPLRTESLTTERIKAGFRAAMAEPKRCAECHSNYADLPSVLCPGCEAYQAHTA
jgi:hypothetical protein